MPITFLGQTKTTPRLITPFHSFNQAFINRSGEIGMPLRNMAMFSGNSGVGKSTLVYTLASIVGNQLGRSIVLADTEDRFDMDFMFKILGNAGYDGFFYNAEGETDTDRVESMLNLLRKDKNYAIGIIDSVGSISPIAEVKGGLEDANMGRRAKVMAVVARQFTGISRNSEVPQILFLVNHLHQNLGTHGQSTSGGVTPEYLSSSCTRLTILERLDDGSKLVKGKVTKNSYGFDNREFRMFNLVGWGFHPGLTAVYDCIEAKIASHERVVKLGDKKFGYMKDMINNFDDPERFQPFIDALKGTTVENTMSTEDEDE